MSEKQKFSDVFEGTQMENWAKMCHWSLNNSFSRKLVRKRYNTEAVTQRGSEKCRRYHNMELLMESAPLKFAKFTRISVL